MKFAGKERKENIILFLFLPASSINIEVRSEGCEDPGKTGGCGIGSIKVDNQEYSLKIRGFNVAVFAEEGTALNT